MGRKQESQPSLPVDAALSTMWGIGRFDNLSEFFHQGSRMGFEKFELNHKITSQMLTGINRDGYSIPVVHEPCPSDISTEALKERDWLISSLHEANRREGVLSIKRSIDLAHDLGSDAIVVHAGHILGLRELEYPIWDLYRQGGFGTPEYTELKEHLIECKASRTDAILEVILRSMRELAAYAGRFGIRLGMENRYHFSDFPGLDEMGVLLDGLDEEIVGFWYDVGHAQALDRLGFYPHDAWLRRFGSRLFGVHFHDVIGLEDHQAPGLGEVDWDIIATYLPQNILHTIEVQPHTSPDQMIASLQFLVDKGCISQV